MPLGRGRGLNWATFGDKQPSTVRKKGIAYGQLNEPVTFKLCLTPPAGRKGEVHCLFFNFYFVRDFTAYSNLTNTPTNIVTCVCHSYIIVEGLKVVEIEKCKNDLKKLRDEMASKGGGR